MNAFSYKKFALIALTMLLVACNGDKKEEIATQTTVTAFAGDIETMKGSEDDLLHLRAFPKSYYKVVTVADGTSFYIDNRVDIIKNELRAGRLWEPEIRQLLQQYVKEGSTAIDVGAHIGTHTIEMARLVGPEGSVIAFEPQQKLYGELVMNSLLNNRKNIIAYRAALGDKIDEIEMATPVVDNEGGTKIGKGGDKAPMITLDSLQLDNVSFIKMDVENFEYQALQGARETILRNKPVMIIEIMGSVYEKIPDRGDQVQRTLSFLEELGYNTSYIPNSWSDWIATPKGRRMKDEG